MKYLSFTSLFLMLMHFGMAQDKSQLQEDIAIIKKNLTESKEKMKGYEWIETTTVFLKGEQKSATQKKCYYGVDGKLTKVAVNAAPAAAPKTRGLKAKVVANKKEDIQEYLQKCMALIKSYLPPDANKLQQLFAAGKASIKVTEPGKKAKLEFPDYNLKGDVLGIDFNSEKKMLAGLSVNPYIDKADDKVDFILLYKVLPDNTQYAGETTLNATAKNIKIVITNDGFKALAKK